MDFFFLDWALDLLDTHTANSYLLQFTLWRSRQFMITVYSVTLFHTLQFITCSLSSLGQLSLASPLVPASSGERSSFWVLKLSPSHSHSDSQCSVHFELLCPIPDWLLKFEVDFATNSQPASSSWCRSPPLGPVTRFYIFFCLLRAHQSFVYNPGADPIETIAPAYIVGSFLCLCVAVLYPIYWFVLLLYGLGADQQKTLPCCIYALSWKRVTIL
jgi:hypothetical protein